jgi:hypothetical protein
MYIVQGITTINVLIDHKKYTRLHESRWSENNSWREK